MHEDWSIQEIRQFRQQAHHTIDMSQASTSNTREILTSPESFKDIDLSKYTVPEATPRNGQQEQTDELQNLQERKEARIWSWLKWPFIKLATLQDDQWFTAHYKLVKLEEDILDLL